MVSGWRIDLRSSPRTGRSRARLQVGCYLAVMLLIGGCSTMPGSAPPPPSGTDNGGGTGNTTTNVSGQIVSFSTNIVLSQGDPEVTVTYAVTGTPDSVSGFYVPVADNSPGAAPIGDRVIIAQGLPVTGPSTRFGFNPGLAGVGFFRVGILLMAGGMEQEALSDGVIQVRRLPSPTFVQPPTGATTVVMQGESVPVSFDLGVPEGLVQWRLFYLTPPASRIDPPDLLGTEILSGTGNLASTTFSTVGLAQDDYQLGLSATDSGFSIGETVANGALDRIVTVLGPVVQVVDVAPPP